MYLIAVILSDQTQNPTLCYIVTYPKQESNLQ